MSSGREDCDVRMLGKGRPFMIELINPKNPFYSADDLAILQSEINKSPEIRITHLQSASKEDNVFLKEGEDNKTKVYCALIVTKTPLLTESIQSVSEVKNLEIDQSTPIRVLHRRSAAVRKRTIYWMSLSSLDFNNCLYILKMGTQSGTYIKEFVHGDLGRTKPSLRDFIHTDVDILELDVLDICMEWPIKRI